MKKILKYQIFHLAGYLILGFFLAVFSKYFIGNSDTLFELTALQWIILSWITAGIFQAWIFLFWRLELYYGRISKIFGKSGFLIFKIGFILLGTIRFLSIIPISFLTRHSMQINSLLRIVLISASAPFIVWAMYSVFFYFGINRAFGADHFFQEYRVKSLEKRGTFKYIPNSMYTIILLLLYYPGLFYESLPGLAVALIHHLFVWIHYFCTERPDLKEIYGKNK